MTRKPDFRDVAFGLLAAWAILIPRPSSAAVKDACTVISSADAEAAIGEAVGPPQPENGASGAGEGSGCRYRSAQGKALSRKSVSLSVRYTNDDLSGSSKGISDDLKSNGFKDVHEVSGVGDRAVWGTTSLMGRSTTELTVLKGKHTMVIVIISGIADDATAIDHAKALALKVLPKT